MPHGRECYSVSQTSRIKFVSWRPGAESDAEAAIGRFAAKASFRKPILVAFDWIYFHSCFLFRHGVNNAPENPGALATAGWSDILPDKQPFGLHTIQKGARCIGCRRDSG